MKRVPLILLALATPTAAFAQAERPAFLDALCASAADGGGLRVYGARPGETAAEIRARLCGEILPTAPRPNFVRPRNRTSIALETPAPSATPMPRNRPKPPAPSAEAPRPALDAESQARVEEARKSFLEQLQRAAAQGIIQPADDSASSALADALGPQNWNESVRRDPETREASEAHAAYEPVETEIETEPHSDAEEDGRHEDGHEEKRDWRRDQPAQAGHDDGEKHHAEAKSHDEEHAEEPLHTPAPLPDPDTAFTHTATRKLLKHLGRAREAGMTEFNMDGSVAYGDPTPPEACIDDTALDVALWGQGEDFRTGVRALRGRLSKDSENASAADVLRIARHYVAYGAGDEARAAIRTYDLRGRDARIVADIADILRGKTPASDGPLMAPGECAGRAALWRAAAFSRTDPPRAAKSYRNAGDMLMELSDPMRHMIGPRIGLAALDAGDASVADGVRLILDRSAGPTDPEYELFTAEHALAKDDDAGVDTLLSLATEPSHVSWDAATRAAPRLANDPDPKRANALHNALEDLTYVLRDTVSGDSALESDIRMRVFYDDLRGALELLDREKERHPAMQEHWNAIERDVVREAMAYSTPQTSATMLSALVEAAARLDRSRASGQARTIFASTLIAAGLPNVAEDMLPQWLVSENPDAERTLERARAMRDPARTVASPPKTVTVPEPEKKEKRNALSGARDLINGIEGDLRNIKELVNDG